MGILSSLLGIGQSAPTPVAPQTISTTELAKEVAPFMKDLLAKGQALYKQRTEEGFQPYTGPTIAQLTPEQLQAREGLTSLVGTQAPTFAKAQELTEGVAEEMTPTALEPFMSPYQQAVTDIEKAEAQKTFERDVLPKVRQAQIGAGAFGGTRGTMLEAQALADQQKLLGDIQTRGSQAAYQDAVRAFEAQKAREGQTAGALAQLAPAAFRAQAGEQGLLETIGKEDQMRSQQALDEAYKQYLEERVFPERTLGQYQSVIAGFPSASVTRTTTAAPQPQQSGLGSLLSGALNLGNIYGTFGGFTKGGFGSAYTPYGRAEGGPVVEKQYGGEVGTGGLVGLTDDGTQIFERTQEGILNRALHGGILEGYNQQTGTTASGTTDAVDTDSTTYTGPTGNFGVSVLPKDLSGVDNSALDPLLSMPSVQSRGGVYNASEFRDAGISLADPEGVTTTIQQGQPQVSSMYRDPHTGKIPYALYQPQPVNTYGDGFDLGGLDYFTANQLALNSGADRFMYNNEYAAVDPGKLSNYDYSRYGSKPYGEHIERDKIREATIGPMHAPGRPGVPYTPSSADREEARLIAEGFTRDYSGRLTVPGTSRAERYRQLVASGVNMDSPYTRQMYGFKHGGLVSLPVVKRQAGNQVFTLPSSPALPEGIDLETLQKLPPSVQQQMLTGNLYNIYQAQMQQDEARKAMEEQDMAAEAARVAEDIDARKSAAIGAMLGSFAKGMKTRAGQGFGQEILGGLEGAAETSTEISEKDRAAIDAAETKLRADRKAAAKEWDKGNRDRALELLTIANTNYDMKLKELQVGYNKLNARNDAIIQLSKLVGVVKESELSAIADNYIAQGLFKDRDEIEKILANPVEVPGARNNNDDSVLTNTERKKNNKITLEPLPDIEMTSPGGGG